MSSMINYGTTRIMNEIPIELLQKVFNPNPVYGIGSMHSREHIIADTLVRNRVLKDCDIVGGEQVVIPLNGLPDAITNGAMIYRIPLSSTAGRYINSVLSLEMGTWNGQYPGANALSSANGPEGSGTHHVKLVGTNTIAVQENIPTANLHLRCILGNDANMNNFNEKAKLAFGEMCVLAAKATIYNKLAIAIGEAGNNGGNTNAATQQMVDSYADATELYNEFVRVRWNKISKLTDRKTHQRIIQMGIMR